MIKNLYCILILIGICKPLTLQSQQYAIRGYLGWIGDLRREHISGENWPYIGIDANLRADYIETLDFIQRAGLNQITLWGLFTSNAWEPDIPSTITAGRAAEINDWLTLAHNRGVKVLAGIGVYSWGFGKIVAYDTTAACGSNGNVMSYSSQSAWEWQKEVIDYVLDNFPFDGVEMQSADKGKCSDGPSNPIEYHAELCNRTGQYIKGKNNNYLVGIATWGLSLRNSADIPHLVYMTAFADYLMDAGNVSGQASGTHRQNIANAISPTLLANMGSPNVEPIQSFQRDRYFIPTISELSYRLKLGWDEGDRAGSFYIRTRGNPGDEVSSELLTAQVNDISGAYPPMLQNILSEIYEPKNTAACDDLVALFLDAESAYFTHANRGNKNIILINQRDVKNADSTPLYLSGMSSINRIGYDAALRNLYQRADALISEVNNTCKMKLVKRCIGRAINDLVTIQGTGSTVSLPALDYCFRDSP